MAKSLTNTSSQKPLFQGWPVISDQISVASLQVIWRELSRVLRQDVSGDVVEFGCYTGTTSLFLRRCLDQLDHADRQLHVYDSFAGLPPKQSADRSPAGEAFVAGELRANRREFIRNFQASGLRVPHIHKAWFADLQPTDVPARIGFAFLDGDFYESIKTSLELIWPKLQVGACVVIDDYQRDALPGVERAVHQFIRQRSVQVQRERNLGILRL